MSLIFFMIIFNTVSSYQTDVVSYFEIFYTLVIIKYFAQSIIKRRKILSL